MKRDAYIAEELNEASKVIANIPFVNTYQVPQGYFEMLSTEILWKINKTNSYTVPDSYFNNLSNSILNKIKMEENIATENELLEVAPTLASLKKTNVYTLPKDYFNNLTIEREEAKVIAFSSKKTKRFTWIKYAVAACMVGVISMVAFHFYNKKAVVAEDQIVAGTKFTYKEIKAVNVDAELAKVNNTELDNYLCEQGLIACNEKADEDLQKELDNLDITDEELESALGEPQN
jgi:hypothetical protein